MMAQAQRTKWGGIVGGKFWPTGCFHAAGEDSNFGIVTIDDRVYDELAKAMTLLNNSAYDVHAVAACAKA